MRVRVAHAGTWPRRCRTTCRRREFPGGAVAPSGRFTESRAREGNGVPKSARRFFGGPPGQALEAAHICGHPSVRASVKGTRAGCDRSCEGRSARARAIKSLEARRQAQEAQRTHWVGTAAIRVDIARLVGRWRAGARRERSGAASEASTGARGHERGRHGRGPRHKIASRDGSHG